MECGDDSSSDWLNTSAAATAPNYPGEIFSQPTASKNGKN